MEILVIEDDRRIASFIERGLTAEGHQVWVESDGRNGLERARDENLDLIVLDRMIPYVEGLELTRILREEKRSVMVLMLTARGEVQDRIDGLRAGADDYLAKPFAFDELIARIDALGRRRGPILTDRQVVIGPLTLDPGARSVQRGDTPIQLTAREFDLLYCLMQNAGRVVSRERLLSRVWRVGYDPGTKIVDVYVRYVRAKIDAPGEESLIQTVRGIGYMMPRNPTR